MGRDIFLLLLGAGIAVISSLLTALVQHFLSLKREKFKKDLEKREIEAREFKNKLLSGAEIHADVVKKFLEEDIKNNLIGRDSLLMSAILFDTVDRTEEIELLRRMIQRQLQRLGMNEEQRKMFQNL